MDKTSLAIFSLVVSVLMCALVIIGYGLHMFNTLQFIIGMATSFTIGGASLSVIFPVDSNEGDQSWNR